jgi:hypothetical protein
LRRSARKGEKSKNRNRYSRVVVMQERNIPLIWWSPSRMLDSHSASSNRGRGLRTQQVLQTLCVLAAMYCRYLRIQTDVHWVYSSSYPLYMLQNQICSDSHLDPIHFDHDPYTPNRHSRRLKLRCPLLL